jgi:hypothetical protein
LCTYTMYIIHVWSICTIMTINSTGERQSLALSDLVYQQICLLSKRWKTQGVYLTSTSLSQHSVPLAQTLGELISLLTIKTSNCCRPEIRSTTPGLRRRFKLYHQMFTPTETQLPVIWTKVMYLRQILFAKTL